MSWGSHALVFESESLMDEIREEVEAKLERYNSEREGKPLRA
jgi:predicted DNA-binding transcriptional regulator YafY